MYCEHINCLGVLTKGRKKKRKEGSPSTSYHEAGEARWEREKFSSRVVRPRRGHYSLSPPHHGLLPLPLSMTLMLIFCQLDISQCHLREGTWTEKHFYQGDPLACLWGHFLKMIDVGRPRPLRAVPPQGRWSCTVQEGRLSKLWEVSNKLCSSMASHSVTAFRFLSWFPLVMEYKM